MTLEELLRDRAKKGELNYLSIAFTERGFEVAYRGVMRDGSKAAHFDPVCAVLKALTGKPGVEPERLGKKVRAPRSTAAAVKDEFDDLLG